MAPDINALLKAARTAMWGGIKPVDHISVTLNSLYNPGTDTVDITLSVHAQELRRAWRSKVYRVASVSFLNKVSIYNAELALSAAPSNLIVGAVRGLLSPPHLFEHDPRFGFEPEQDSTRQSLPRSPLFDPTRLRLPQWERRAALDSVPCSLCDEPFGSGMPAMWGGGNLLWVHPDCFAETVAD